MAKYTTKDIKFIAQHIRDTKKQGQTIALLTGAGCSKSAGIPLASELVSEINNTNNRYYTYLRGLNKEQCQDYGHCMNAIDRSMRNDLLGPYLKEAKINWSHIAIALLIKKGFVGRVLTFNFDNILSRACGLCGEYPAIYDYATAASNSCKHISSPAIIHLHGQGTGMLMLNDKQETDEHVKNIEPLLLNTLENHPLLAIGYSGSSDPAFNTLNALYDKQNKIHWCDYQQEPELHIQEFITKDPSNIYHYAEVEADSFLLKLAQELECFDSCIFTDPINHLRNETKDVLPFPGEQENSSSTFDPFEKLKQELNRFEEHTKNKNTNNEQPDFYNLFIQGKYQKIINLYENEYKDNKNIDSDIIANAYFYQALSTEDSEVEALLNQQACAIKPDFHQAFNNWGIALRKLEKYQQACEKYQQACKIKPDKHEAFNNWGIALDYLEEYQEACEKYQQACKIKPDFHEAFNNWGAALSNLKQYEKACEKYQQACKIKPDYHKAFNNWGLALRKLEKYQQACEKFQRACEIKPDDDEAFYNWASALIYLFHKTKDPKHLQQAQEKSQKALALKPENAYNAACIAALLEDEKACKKHLHTCQQYGTLPDTDHLESDIDLDFVKDKKWFKALLSN